MGAQGYIDLYHKKDVTHVKLAVKTFTKPKDNNLKTEKVNEMIRNEIQFLRDLNQCENFIELQEVYRK